MNPWHEGISGECDSFETHDPHPFIVGGRVWAEDVAWQEEFCATCGHAR